MQDLCRIWRIWSIEMVIQYDNFDIFRKNISSFRETSKDTTNSNIISYMTQSEVKVVDFDKVKDEYISKMKLSTTPCSTDALYINKKSQCYFVEFKNGKISKGKIYSIFNKIYDSLLIFNDIVNVNISFCRENVNFILVYNETKNPNTDETIMNQDKNSRVEIGKYFSKKAKKHFIRFDLEKFQKIYFHEVYTYTEKEFEEQFLLSIE